MSRTITFNNVYMTYIDNAFFQYPSIDVETIIIGTHPKAEFINTGWHIIPNFLWRHVLTPRQWAAFVTECEAYQIKSIHGTVYNPIPITTNLSLQRVNLFSAFNNCTYAMTFSDKMYETSWFPWYDLPRNKQLHLALKEGVIWTGNMQSSSGSTQHTYERYQWPIYQWQRPNMKTIFDNVWSQGKTGGNGVYNVDATTNEADPKLAVPSGVFWDPFNCPDDIGELRAGKNAIDFKWTTASCDEGKWYNLDQIAQFSTWTTDGPYCGVGRPYELFNTTKMDPAFACTYGLAEANATDSTHPSGVVAYEDYTIPNMANMPIVPTKWFWKEIENSIIDWDESTGNTADAIPFYRKANKYWAGTEWECYTYPPCQWFIKGIPLCDANNDQIRTTTQVSFRISITLEGKIRRSAYYAPTHGPWSGEQLYTATNKRAIFQPACIRYRTAGRRRTWQNMQTKEKFATANGGDQTYVNKQNLIDYPRQDPYIWEFNKRIDTMVYNNDHHPVGIPDRAGANRMFQPAIKVKWTKDTDTTEIIMEEEEPEKRPEPTPRKSGSISKLLQLH
ncbi:capsid protein 1 [Duck-associated chapparvovirus 1]|uniref:Capsid protein 1 n=1 Tax=Duck-associated chapparvovirus 1 TaxID=2810802 RepID=A0A891F0A8_9VIRU|nr:capsid protein 1 [Duck-associated chapparvovirus 1]QRK03681.1 capsid protein 1 [Duck-associated chapparvovirus 1]QRK03685.1 capsid protein 1 [Duck-associated chapparvovirus 1]